MSGPHDHDHHDHDHDHDHGHGHHHHGAGGDLRALWIALALTGLFMVVEFAAGWLTGSLALMADAWHMLSDVGSLALAVFATYIGQRPRSVRKTFGYKRFEVLAALGNGVMLGAAAVLIVREAWERFFEPQPVKGVGVMVVGTLGLAVNLTSAWILHRQGAHNVNVRAALAHVLGDALGSCAAILSGLIVATTGQWRADPLLSVAVSLLILWSAWKVVAETSHILMEGTPAGLDPKAIEEAIRKVPGVQSVHDLHVWSITAGEPAVTAHVVLAEGGWHGAQVARAVCDALEEQFALRHSTIQPEPHPPRIVQLGTPQAPDGRR